MAMRVSPYAALYGDVKVRINERWIGIETARMKIESVISDDIYAVGAVYRDRADRLLQKLDETHLNSKVKSWLNEWAKGNFYSGYGVVNKCMKEFVGVIVLKSAQQGVVKINCLFLKRYWDCGYSKECVHAIVYHLLPAMKENGSYITGVIAKPSLDIGLKFFSDGESILDPMPLEALFQYPGLPGVFKLSFSAWDELQDNGSLTKRVMSFESVAVDSLLKQVSLMGDWEGTVRMFIQFKTGCNFERYLQVHGISASEKGLCSTHSHEDMKTLLEIILLNKNVFPAEHLDRIREIVKSGHCTPFEDPKRWDYRMCSLLY